MSTGEVKNVSDANREARIVELRRLVTRNEYQIDSPKVASRLVDEALALADLSSPDVRSSQPRV